MTTFRTINTDQEFEALDGLYHQCFGSASIPTQVLQSWWHAYPNGLIGLLSNNEVIGGVSIWSLDNETYDLLKKGLIKERDTRPDNMKHISCDKYYVSEIAIIDQERNVSNLSQLLQGVIEHLREVNFYPKSILALGYSNEGVNLMKRLGFNTQLSAEKTPDKQPLFELIVESEEELQKLLTRLKELQQRRG